MIRAKLKFINHNVENIIQVDLNCVPNLGERIYVQELFFNGEVRRMYHEIIRIGIENRLVHILVIELQ